MDWSAFAGVVAAAIGAVAGAGWLAQDRERSKLERDIEMYQKEMPRAAKTFLGTAIKYRAHHIYATETAYRRSSLAYLNGLMLIWYAGSVVFSAWLLALHVDTPSIIGFVVVLLAPVVYFGWQMRQRDKLREEYREAFKRFENELLADLDREVKRSRDEK